MIRLALAGAAGRMGRHVLHLAADQPEFDMVAALESATSEHIGADSGELAGIGKNRLPVQDHTYTEFDVLLDFSTPDGTMHWLEFCLVQKRPIVVCTTGHDEKQSAAIRVAAGEIAVLKAANTSLGVTVMLQLVEQAARALAADADIEIVEAHHRFKQDAPSGTANALLESAAAGLHAPAAPTVAYGRRGERKRGEIGMHSLRIGDATGEHEVHFGMIGETLTIRHRAHSRETFARGALRAVRWMAGRPAGWYTMNDVLIQER